MTSPSIGNTAAPTGVDAPCNWRTRLDHDTDDGRGVFNIEDNDRNVIAEFLWEEHADRIVQCVNAHDDMLAALRQAEKWIVAQMLDKGCPADRLVNPPEGSHLFNIRAAIAKATGAA